MTPRCDERHALAADVVTLSEDIAHELHRRVRARRQRDAYPDFHEIYGLGEVTQALRMLAMEMDPTVFYP
jgi:hypothetical protein